MRTPVTKHNAFKALTEYYKQQYGIKLTKNSGVKIVNVDDTGLIEYTTANEDTRYVRASVETFYVCDKVDPATVFASPETAQQDPEKPDKK